MKRYCSILPTALVACVFAAMSAGGADMRSRQVKFVEYIESDSDRLAYIQTTCEPHANTEIEMDFAFTRADLDLKTYVFGEYGSGGARLTTRTGYTTTSPGSSTRITTTTTRAEPSSRRSFPLQDSSSS